MGVAFGQVDAESGPPSDVPLQHFVAGLVFLVVGVLAGVVAAVRPVYALPHVHILLVGWVCTTIMGAMTQFVPVWSDVSLHSRRLGRVQLVLVTVGVSGLVLAFGAERYGIVFFPGVIVLAGFWTFVYNIGATLPSLNPRRLDVTERHFLFALVFVVVVTALGVTLAADYRWRILSATPLRRSKVVEAHATVAVLGIVVTTVLGAMYQLVGMFTQTEPSRLDAVVERFETGAYPLGVVLVAVGVGLSEPVLSGFGAALVLFSLAAFAVVSARRLYTSRVGVIGHPMLVRYVPALFFLGVWTVAVAPRWIGGGVSFPGQSVTTHLLLVGFVGYVVVGTLYHIVPFLIWVERYSDRLGLEDVPMIDDLYGARLERTDLVLTLGGGIGVVVGMYLDSATVVVASGGVAVLGYGVFAANMFLVVHRHEPDGIVGIFRRVVGMR